MLNAPPVPVRIYSFHNCDIHYCHLDGYGTHRSAFRGRLQEVESHFASASVNRTYRVWYNVDGSALDREALRLVAASVGGLQKQITRIAFVGMPLLTRPSFERLLKQAGFLPPRRYFSDAELAKEWLV